jgi:RND family efflux transporter MFP subunit
MVVPDGCCLPVTAPLTGTLTQIDNSFIVVAGQRVDADQPLLKLSPMLRPEQEVPTAAERVQMANARASLVSQQIQASGDEKQAQARVDGAQIAFDRAEQLLADKAGSRRQLDDAEAALNVAREELQAARERRELLDKLSLEVETGTAPTITIEAPQAGIIQTVSAQPGQVVSAGSALFEIVDLNRMWVRVPVYAGLVQEINRTANASVGPLSGNGDTIAASPVTAPPTATLLSASIDLYYAVDNSNGRFRPGERVAVNVPLIGEDDSLVIPRAAVLRDIHGTAWVYVKSGEHEFRRQRVCVVFNTHALAVLSLGPEVGTPIVVDGAAELFGTEFGAGK